MIYLIKVQIEVIVANVQIQMKKNQQQQNPVNQIDLP